VAIKVKIQQIQIEISIFLLQEKTYSLYSKSLLKIIMTSKPIIVVISGIIGAGKTTLINLLGHKLTQEGLKVVIVKEPVDEWKTSGILQEFYANVPRWGYTFQAEAFRSRIMTIRKALENPGADIVLMERSPWDDKIFMEMLRDTEKITEMEWKLYLGWCEMWELLLPVTPDLFILLAPPVEECQKRVRSRGRPGEDKISDDYQSSLEEYHDRFFSSGDLTSSGGSKLTEEVKKEEKIEETCALVGNLMVPCYHLKSKENFKDDEKVQEKMVGLFKRIIRIHS